MLTGLRYSGGGKKLSKRVSNARLNSRLGPVLTHTDLLRELAQLEGSQPRKDTSPEP
jgi:hypothetical protein